MFESQAGNIPSNDKLQWLKDNISRIAVNWHGFGSGPSGNKVDILQWSVTLNTWVFNRNHTNASVTKLSLDFDSTKPNGYKQSDIIDSNGFIHLLAFAEPSDGTTASVLNIDYVEAIVDTKEIPVPRNRPAKR